MIEKYDIEYMGVKCTGVDWAHPVNNVFYFTKDGQNYTYMQTEYISSSADTDHIRCVIEEQFLPWWKNDRIKELEAENADLKNSLSKLTEECLKWHERAQNLIKENGGSISCYEKTISELRARLDKSVELKDPYYVVDNDSGMIRLYYEKVVRYGELYEDLEEAVARLAELKAKK